MHQHAATRDITRHHVQEPPNVGLSGKQWIAGGRSVAGTSRKSTSPMSAGSELLPSESTPSATCRRYRFVAHPGAWATASDQSLADRSDDFALDAKGDQASVAHLRATDARRRT